MGIDGVLDRHPHLRRALRQPGVRGSKLLLIRVDSKAT